MRSRIVRTGLAFAGPVLLVSAILVGGAAHGQSPAPSAAAVDPASAPVLADPTATGTALVTAYTTAVADGDVDALGALLAPGFQILRANGDHWDTASYLAQGLPTISSWSIDDVVATQSGPVLTVYWLITSTQVVDGVAQPSGAAPRLSSFVWLDGRWLLASHANFGTVNR